jgi:hypothetical protein
MTEDRKHAILLAATILAARKLHEIDPDKQTPAKICAVENAIRHAAYIMEMIDRKWPDNPSSPS